MRTAPAVLVLSLLSAVPAPAAEDGSVKQALEAADRAVAAAPEAVGPRLNRAALFARLGRHAEAVADLDKAVAVDPKAADAYELRGGEQFKLGRFKESLADFDRQLELRPADRPGHWQRGITCYYVGKYEEGRKQFEGYEKVDTNDVENAIWHYLCVARADGPEKARAALLKIGKDRRVPLMAIYDLFAGRAKPADVLAAVDAGDPPAAEKGRRLFYAHLYLGLYAEVVGDAARAREHMNLAADKYRIDHYMGDVARVHAKLLNEK